MCGCVGGWVGGCVGGWVRECVGGWVQGCVGGFEGVWMGGFESVWVSLNVGVWKKDAKVGCVRYLRKKYFHPIVMRFSSSWRTIYII